MYACLYQPPARETAVGQPRALVTLAQDFSPRFERHRDDLVSIDVSGLDQLLGNARTIGEELCRAAAARGLRVHVAIAGTWMAALVLALAHPGLTVVDRAAPAAEALAPLPIGILEKVVESFHAPVGVTPERHGARASARGGGGPATPYSGYARAPRGERVRRRTPRAISHDGGLLESPEVSIFKHWGVKTLGELAALPSVDLATRLGQSALAWQAIARGEDVHPLVPDLPEERFVSSLELEWPIEGLEPLSFVLTRLLEPLSTRLERRDRGAAALHVTLGLVTRPSTSSGRGEPVEPRDTYTRSLQLPLPIRDVRMLRTLVLLDLESHPPSAAIDRVTVLIDPTPGRVLQHTLFTRAHPTPEQVSTLLARLGALMGQDRIGAPAVMDSYRPGAFTMMPFASACGLAVRGGGDSATSCSVPVHPEPGRVRQALRRCRQSLPARVTVHDGQPVYVTTDRRGCAGGAVLACAGPWRTSGEWWGPTSPAKTVRASGVGVPPSLRFSEPGPSSPRSHASEGRGGHANRNWHCDEWDVALSDGMAYRMFCDRKTDRWFIGAIID